MWVWISSRSDCYEMFNHQLARFSYLTTGLKTCVYPCGTFSRMANLLSKGQICKLLKQNFILLVHIKFYNI